MTRAVSDSLSPAIKAEGLTKSFGTNLALRGIDLEIEEGDSVVIFGPNGAGKSTLIKILSTVMNPSSGSLKFRGRDLKNRAEEIRREIGLVPHQTLLYNNLTAYENLNFYGQIYDVPERKDRIAEVADMVAITSRLNDRVGTLSRGLQQRVSVARALLHKPSIMLLDEPETGLDQEAITSVWTALEKGDEFTRTIIFTTHNLELGLKNCRRLLILDNGKIAYQGTREGFDLASLRETYRLSTKVSV